jgi:hypothetical protein
MEWPGKLDWFVTFKMSVGERGVKRKQISFTDV